MTTAFQRRLRPWLILLVAWGLGACRAAEASTHSTGQPINVASTIAGCKDLGDCVSQCTEQSPSSCVAAGRLYEFGHGVAPDPAAAFRLYERACAWKYAGGCYNAAVLLEAGKGAEKDSNRARELFARVCKMGSKTSCERARSLGDTAQL